MTPSFVGSGKGRAGFPRSRGDDPRALVCEYAAVQFSLLTRG